MLFFILLEVKSQAVYLGEAPLPDHFTVHDVCSMVKRFFRDLKEPLLPSGGVRKALLELARRDELSPVRRILVLFFVTYVHRCFVILTYILFIQV